MFEVEGACEEDTEIEELLEVVEEEALSVWRISLIVFSWPDNEEIATIFEILYISSYH